MCQKNNMPNAIVRNVLTSIFLVVLCFVIGVESAESAKASVGIIIALVGSVFLIWMGPRVWVLIYLVPPVMTLLPLPGKIAELPVSFLIGGVVLFYWIVMWGMGYVKFHWRAHWPMDLIVTIIGIYMAISYYRHPVSMAVFGYDSDYIGGKEYVWCICAIAYYIAISAIPCTCEQLIRVLRWGIRLSLFACVLAIVLSLLGIRGGTDITELGEAATTSRFTMFVSLSIYGIFFLYGQYPMMQVLTTPRLLVGCLLCVCGILISGWREVLMSNCFVIAALAFVKKELWCLTLLGMLAYGGLLYLSSEGLVKMFPYGMQRCLTVAPGIEVSRDVEASAGDSSEWRVEMWRWALDKRTKYIQDYVWGDGFGQSVDYLRRETTAMMRGTVAHGDQDFYASTGTWHSGVITSIHRLGYIGLCIISLVYIYSIILMFRTCMVYRGTSLFLPAIFFLLPFAASPSLFYVSAGTITKFFTDFAYISLIKLMFCVAREQGLVHPLLMRKRYIPAVIQEQESSPLPVR